MYGLPFFPEYLPLRLKVGPRFLPAISAAAAQNIQMLGLFGPFSDCFPFFVLPFFFPLSRSLFE